MKIQPKNGFIVLREPPREQITDSGILIPEASNREDPEQTTYGEVIESSHEDYKEGDVVLFPKVLPNDFEVELVKGKKEVVWFLHHEQVMGVLEK